MGNSTSQPSIPVISMQGIITPSSSVSFKKINPLLEDAFKRPGVKTVVLLINSPGGSPVQCEYIYNRIRALARKHSVKVVAFIQDTAASGGYYLACAADEIYASPSSIIGSIGVIASGFGFHSFLEKHGIERRIYAQGENKALLDPFLPQKDSDVNILNAIGKDLHTCFMDRVKTARASKLDLEYAGLFTGEVWSGKRALELGLVDGLGDMHTVLGTESKFVYMKEKLSFLASLTSSLTVLSSVVLNSFSLLYPNHPLLPL
jgi:signal peptide peptidase SppA